MMDQKLETIEVSNMSDDDTVKEKFTYNTNGTDHELNDGRLTLISDDVPTKNGQPSDKNQSNDDCTLDDHQNWDVQNFYKQLKILCFPGSKKKTKQKKRIQVSTNSNEVNSNHLPQDACKYRCNKKLVEISLLGIAILTVVAIFMIPVILYYTGPPIQGGDESMIEFFKTCVADVECSNFADGSQVCDPEDIASVSFIPTTFAPNQDIAEKRLSAIFNVTSSSSEQCNSDAMSFFCKAAYRSCIFNASLFPTTNECERLSNTCNTEWGEIQTVAPFLTCCNSYNLNPVCPDQFDKFCGSVCAPICHEFSQVEETTTVALQVNGIATAFSNITFGIIVFVVAFFKRNTVFHFPSVLILYFTAVFMLYEISATLPHFWREELLCSHRNLFVTITEPTTFCQIQGFVLDATIMILTEFWFLFVFHLFMKIVDPLKSWIINRSEHSRKVHIIEIVAVFVLGLIVPTITVTATEGYNIAIFPPSQCFSQAEIFFHGILLPITIMCIVGISLILFTLFHIHRTTGIFKRMKKRRAFVLSVPEVKLLLVSFYLTIMLGAGLIHFTLNVRTVNDRVDATMDYSLCVANGNCNCDDKRKTIEDISIPETTFLFFIFAMFLNCSNLLFIIQFQDVKQVARCAAKGFISRDLNCF